MSNRAVRQMVFQSMGTNAQSIISLGGSIDRLYGMLPAWALINSELRDLENMGLVQLVGENMYGFCLYSLSELGERLQRVTPEDVREWKGCPVCGGMLLALSDGLWTPTGVHCPKCKLDFKWDRGSVPFRVMPAIRDWIGQLVRRRNK